MKKIQSHKCWTSSTSSCTVLCSPRFPHHSPVYVYAHVWQGFFKTKTKHQTPWYSCNTETQALVNATNDSPPFPFYACFYFHQTFQGYLSLLSEKKNQRNITTEKPDCFSLLQHCKIKECKKQWNHKVRSQVCPCLSERGIEFTLWA